MRRQVLADMELEQTPSESNHPLPMSTLKDTVVSEETASELRQATPMILVRFPIWLHNDNNNIQESFISVH